MERQTVDFGIDLGTTNSAIARATPRRIEIVPSRTDAPITPSAVAYTPEGRTLVGQDALNRVDLQPARWFKRLMGTESRVGAGAGKELLPEELSAEVLKELKAAVQLRYDVEPEYVVITVPAMFLQPQCEATHRAAELAGLKAVTLLQEPIAAATAYLNEDPQEGDYLVYDLGGGTFDVSIVRLRGGEMNVLGHGGDNFLGGADFDRALLEWVVNIQLRPRYGAFPELLEEPARGRLLLVCEDARKRLSTQKEVLIDLADFGLPVDQLALTRDELEAVIGEHVDRTLALTRERIKAVGLTSEDLSGILLVGGPTKTPFVRQQLKTLGIPLFLDHDPMTVVAEGAAIHASGLLKPNRAASSSSQAPEEIGLELFYDPVTPDERTTLSGRITSHAGFAGEVRVARASGDWDTGWIPLRNGAFLCDLVLHPNRSTEFRLSVRDDRGTIRTASPAVIAIRHGIASAQPVTPYKYGVALEDGSMGKVVEENQPLPAAATREFRASRTIPAGSDEELIIYFLEGHSRIAEDNSVVGKLVIRGQELRRTLKEGERLEIRIRMDESRLLKARVSIPVHDLDYEVQFTSLIVSPPVEDLVDSYRESVQQLAEIQKSVSEEDEDALRKCRAAAERVEAEVKQLREGDRELAAQAQSHLAGFKADLRELTVKYGVQAAYRQAMQSIEDAEKISQQFGVAIDAAAARDLRPEAERGLRMNSETQLKAVEERADAIFWSYYVKTPECWIHYVEYLQKHRGLASDGPRYHEALRRVEECLRRDDFEGCRINVIEAWKYLPEDETRRSQFEKAWLRA